MRNLIQTINREFLETAGIHGADDSNPGVVAFYFFARRLEVSTAISAYDGYKLVLSPTNSQSITDIVKRGLLLADLVILNHETLSTTPSLCFFVVPKWFPRKERKFNKLKGVTIPPHLVHGSKAIFASGDEYKLKDGSWDGVPTFANLAHLPHDIASWCLSEGKPLLDTGEVVYAPLLPP